MQTTGDYLRKCRKAQNLSLSDIAEMTKITKIYLEYLEKNKFEKIPAKPYVKGYIASYAACLGVDPHEALKLYDAYENESHDSDELTTENLQGYGNPIPRRRRLIKYASLGLAVGMIFLLSVGLYYSFFMNQKQAVVADNFIEQPATKPQRLISTAAYKPSPKNQNTVSVQGNHQNGHSQPIEPKEVREKTINGHSQISKTPHIQRSKRYTQNVPSDQPAPEFAFTKKTSGSNNAPIPHQQDAIATRSFVMESENKPARSISTVAYDLPPKKRNGISHQSSQTNGFTKPIEPGIVQKTPVNGQSQVPSPRQNHQSTGVVEDVLPDHPIQEIASVNESPGPNSAPETFDNHLKIIEAAACSSVKNRSPQGSGDSFEWSEDKIFIWTRIQCERLPSSIRHIYYFKGEKVNDISLSVRSSHWRTWSYKTISNKRYIGPWRVDITSDDGKLLQSINFEII